MLAESEVSDMHPDIFLSAICSSTCSHVSNSRIVSALNMLALILSSWISLCVYVSFIVGAYM